MWKKCLNNIENVGQADRTCKQTKYKKTIPIHGGKALQKMSFSLIQEDLR